MDVSAISERGFLGVVMRSYGKIVFFRLAQTSHERLHVSLASYNTGCFTLDPVRCVAARCGTVRCGVVTDDLARVFCQVN